MAHPLLLEASRRKFQADCAVREASAKQSQADFALHEASAKEYFAARLVEDARVQQNLAARTAWEAGIQQNHAYHSEFAAQERSNTLFLAHQSAVGSCTPNQLNKFLETEGENWRASESYGCLDVAAHQAFKAKYDASQDFQAADVARYLATCQAKGARAAHCMASSWAEDARRAREFANHQLLEAHRAKQNAECQMRDASIAYDFALQHVRERATLDFHVQPAVQGSRPHLDMQERGALTSDEQMLTQLDQMFKRATAKLLPVYHQR